jgi:hypothetical protein
MRKTWASFLGTAVLAVGSIPASAVPITFDLGGTFGGRSITDEITGQVVLDGSQAGQSFAARFVVDTDALEVRERVDDVDADFLLIRDAGTTIGVQSSLTIGGVVVDVTPYPTHTSYVQFNDSHGPIPYCNDSGCYSATTPDAWIVGTRSGPVPASTTRSIFTFTLQEPVDSAVPGSGTTWLDFSQPTGPELLATLPTGARRIFLSFTEYAGSTRTSSGFEVTSFSRTVSSVPEPGSLGLLAMGLLGAFAARRAKEVGSA